MLENELLNTLFWKSLYAIGVVLTIMSIAGYSVLAERKVSGWIQGRVGPNRTALPVIAAIPIIGTFLRKLGMFQPMADGAKFLFKEEPVPAHVNKVYYLLAPVVTFIPALLTVAVVPFGVWWDEAGNQHPLVLADIEVGILFLLAISSLGVYGIVMAGWAANSKYPFMGGIRSSAQMISYELAMGISILPVFLWANAPGTTGTMTLYDVAFTQDQLWLVFWQPVSAFIFLVALFAETNRLPFDMPESETELVGGFHTEYGGFKFGLFFVSEYAHIAVGSAVFTLLFLGGWDFLPFLEGNPWPSNTFGSIMSMNWFILKTCALIFFFIWVRWTLPRFRYDQVMNIGWKMLLPLAIANLVFYIIAIALYDMNTQPTI